MEYNLKVHQGSIFGGILLVAGCCIGAGMLGLPVLSAFSGFVPALCILTVAWLYMICTGLLVLEVTLHFPHEVNIVSMAKKTLGKSGQAVAWLVFLFLFYCLMTAYIAAGGDLLAGFLEETTGIAIGELGGSMICAVLLAIFLFCGTRATDHFNRLLMCGLVASYIALVFVGAPHVKTELLTYANWGYSLGLLPIMIVSFGFHNLIPSLTHYLHRDSRRLKATLWIGSFIPFIVYVVWEALILGLVPVEQLGSLQAALNKGDMATDVLKATSGSTWVANMAEYFAFFAIITSFLGVGLSFVDFLADGLKVKKTEKGKALLCTFVILPSLFFAFSYPHIFLMALNYAGGVGAVILFGILPALMAWSGRYKKELWKERFVPGEKSLLVFLIIFSSAIVVMQLLGGSS